jgi:hypothetical protein
VVRKGLGVLTRDGDWHVVVENPREDGLATFLDRLEAATAVPDDLLACVGPRLQFPTGVCFAGQDLRTAYVGSLAMSRLPTFRAPVPGLPMRHWSWAIQAEPAGPLLGQHRRSGRLVAWRRSAAPARRRAAPCLCAHRLGTKT